MRRGFPLLASATAFAVVANAMLLLTLAWELAATDRRGLLGLLLAISAATAVHYPADRAVVVELVPEESLDRANGILQTLMNTGNIAGPALAAASIGWIGASPTLLVAAAEYLCGALILLLIPGRRLDAPAEQTAETGLLASIVEGFRFAWKDRSLLTLLLVIGAVNLGWPVNPTSLGVIAAAMAALALTHSPVVGTAVMLAGGIGSGMANVVLVTAIQRRTPREQMGRIMGTMTLMTMGLGPVSLALAGALIGIMPAFWIILGGAALILLTVPCVIGPARAVAAAHQEADGGAAAGSPGQAR